MDFVNHAEEMEEAFAPFYTTTVLSNTATIAQLRELENKIDGYNVWMTAMWILLQALSTIRKASAPQPRGPSGLPVHPACCECAEESVQRGPPACFYQNCRGFVRLYEFLSMASSFGDPELHKKYVFVNLLLTYLVVGNSGGISLKDKIQATNFCR